MHKGHGQGHYGDLGVKEFYQASKHTKYKTNIAYGYKFIVNVKFTERSTDIHDKRRCQQIKKISVLITKTACLSTQSTTRMKYQIKNAKIKKTMSRAQTCIPKP